MYAKKCVGILCKLLLKLEVPWFNQINEATQTNVDMNNKGI